MIKCVNMENKTCFFGYGGIRVSTSLSILYLRGIRPPMEVGTDIMDKYGSKIGEWEYTGDKFCISFNNMDEIHIFCNFLKVIEDNQGGIFEFKNVIFDFTYYEQASITVLKHAINSIKMNILLAVAC